MADVAKEAGDAVKKGGAAILKPINWTFKQVVLPEHWFRNTAIFASAVAVGVTAASLGVTLPFVPLAAGTITTTAGTAGGAGAAAATTTAFWPTVGHVAANAGIHAANGFSFAVVEAGSLAKAVVTQTDWGMVAKGFSGGPG